MTTEERYERHLFAFIGFVIRLILKPIADFPFSLSTEVAGAALSLYDLASNQDSRDEDIDECLHAMIWGLIEEDNPGRRKNWRWDPLHLFLVASSYNHKTLRFNGGHTITPRISGLQWCLRIFGAMQVHKLDSVAMESNQQRQFDEHVRDYFTSKKNALFSISLNNQHMITQIVNGSPAKAPEFCWDVTGRVASYEGFPIPISSYLAMIQKSIRYAEGLLEKVCQGFAISDILSSIEHRLNQSGSKEGVKQWYTDQTRNEDPDFSFLDIPSNGLQEHEQALIQHFGRSKVFFSKVGTAIVPKRSE